MTNNLKSEKPHSERGKKYRAKKMYKFHMLEDSFSKLQRTVPHLDKNIALTPLFHKQHESIHPPSYYLKNFSLFVDEFRPFIDDKCLQEWNELTNDEDRKKWMKKIKERKRRIQIKDHYSNLSTRVDQLKQLAPPGCIPGLAFLNSESLNNMKQMFPNQESLPEEQKFFLQNSFRVSEQTKVNETENNELKKDGGVLDRFWSLDTLMQQLEPPPLPSLRELARREIR